MRVYPKGNQIGAKKDMISIFRFTFYLGMKSGVKEAMNKILLDLNYHIGNIDLDLRITYVKMSNQLKRIVPYNARNKKIIEQDKKVWLNGILFFFYRVDFMS